MEDAEEEQLDRSKMMSAGIVASVATGPMSANHVVNVDMEVAVVTVEEEGAALEDAEADLLRKYFH